MNCNDQVVTIAKIVSGGYGLSEAADGRKLFVRHCLPGETVAVEITEEKKRICFGPAVQVRDLQVLVESGMSIKAVQPVDMFPQTHHLETVVMLEKIDNPPNSQ